MSRRQVGFTLIEVLVALLVFALIATASAQVGSQYIGSFERIRDKTLASWIAENRLAELRLADAPPEVSENDKDLDYGQYRWQVTTKVTATEETSIRRIDVTVAKYPGNQGEPQSVHTLSGFIRVPQP